MVSEMLLRGAGPNRAHESQIPKIIIRFVGWGGGGDSLLLELVAILISQLINTYKFGINRTNMLLWRCATLIKNSFVDFILSTQNVKFLTAPVVICFQDKKQPPESSKFILWWAWFCNCEHIQTQPNVWTHLNGDIVHLAILSSILLLHYKGRKASVLQYIIMKTPHHQPNTSDGLICCTNSPRNDVKTTSSIYIHIQTCPPDLDQKADTGIWLL